MNAVLIVGGLALLVVGAEFLVRAGTALATWLGIRPMIIGLTVVSLGTSAPELAIGIDASLNGSPALAVGNRQHATRIGQAYFLAHQKRIRLFSEYIFGS